ncbi:MAG TPA: MlaD family protein [Fimbriimonadaceae bacterium]|nr:MlaD family protein [Fimbriimonadaceae bacterium]
MIVFVLLLYGGYAILGRAFAKPEVVTYYSDFADAGGTASGTVVTMAGVKIGTVTKVELRSATTARLTLEINRGVEIPKGSVAKIGASLIGIGASPIQIVAPATPPTAYLAAGDVIPGIKGSPIEGMLPEAQETLKQLNLTLASTRKLLENETLEKKLEALIDSSGKTLDKFGALADRAEVLVAKTTNVVGENQPAIAQAMHNASLAMADVRKSTQLLSKLIESGKYQEETLTLLKQLNATAAKANDLMVNINSFVTDPKLQANLKDTMANVDKITDSGTRIASNTETISKNGITLSQKAIELADKANSIADEAKAALEKISGFFNKGGVSPSLPKVEGHLDLSRQSDPGHWRTDLYGRFDIGKGFLDAGLYDAFESNKVILQVGEPLGRLGDYRYGIYASKPGVGVDFRVAPRVTLRTDLFDINNPRFDLRTQFDFGNGLTGWLGFERIFDRDAFVAGVGIKK